jgi:DNA-binding response OmpR family regulator
VISAGPITIDPEQREARVHGDLLLLTADEFELLAVLAAEPSREWATRDEFELLAPDSSWLPWDVRSLAAKLTRVGIEHDLARTDGLYRLFRPEQGGEQ